MSRWTLLWRTVWFFWRSNGAVGAGVAVAAAVITGALLLGDSLRGSLWATALQRLGPVDAVLRTDRFFREALADQMQHHLAAHPRSTQSGLEHLAPIILLEAAVETAGGETAKIVGGVQVIGCDHRFWQPDPSSELFSRLQGPPEGSSAVPPVVLNEVLADQLQVRAGQEILIRLPQWGRIAPESALGRKHDTVQTWRVRVAGVVGGRTWAGRFALAEFQQSPRLAYVPLTALQRRLNEPGRVNAILAMSQSTSAAPPEDQEAILAEIVRPAPEDYGVRIERVEQGQYSYIHITTDRLLFEPALENAIRQALAGEHYQPVLTYLANRIELSSPGDQPVTQQDDQGRIVPYSTITALELEEKEPFGPFRTVDGRLLPPLQDGPEPEIVLNLWTAQSLGLPVSEANPSDAPDPMTGQKAPPEKPDSKKTGVPQNPKQPLRSSAGEKGRHGPGVSENPKTPEQPPRGASSLRYIYVSFFEPESVHGQTVERTERFRLAGVVPMEGPAADRHLTPEVPGLTDRRSIAQWDVPFQPFHEGLIRRADDDYFRRHGLTPKAFVSLATGWRLWASRFGRVSSFRVAPSPTATVENLRRRIEEAVAPGDVGFTFQPVKRRALAAAEGSTSFEMLFLGFSGFLILSAAMLVLLLFRLGIQARQQQLGLLLALGFTSQQMQRLLLAEGAIAAVLGSGVGSLAGWGYAAIVLWGFRAWAGSALNVSLLQLHGRPESFLAGFLAAGLLGMGAIVWAVRRTARTSPRHLLSLLPLEEAETSAQPSPAGKTGWIARWLPRALAVGAVGLGLLGGLGGPKDEMAQAGLFFGAGVLMLGAGLLWVRKRFRPANQQVPSAGAFTGRWALVRLAFRTAARNPHRSSLTVGLMAAAVFLLTATSIFRLQMPGPVPQIDDGTGGLRLWMETTLPIFYDLADPKARANLSTWTESQEQTLLQRGVEIFSVRMRFGDDASCRNLYRPAQPRILGLPKSFLHRPAFAWADTLANTAEEKANPWLVLERPAEQDADGLPVIPAVLDADTATYALKVGLGQQVEIQTDSQGRVRLQIVGLLRRSIFQGDLLISEQAFVGLFPQVQGYRLFLASIRPEHLAHQAEVEKLWQQSLADYGLRLQTTQARLADFFAVQNIYLAAFQSLGGLGLLLGVLGLGVVQVRNVLERRRELALLEAVGFSPARLRAMILWETWLLLALGLGCGAVAAAVAVWPHWLTGARTLPWTALAGGLASVLAVGTLAGLAAVQTALRMPLLQTLRTE